MRTRSPVLHQRQPAADRRFRRGVEDGRRAGRARLAAVADAGQRVDAPLQQIVRRLHVHDFGAARIADRAGAAHEQDRMRVDFERRVVDPVMIILRPVEHDGPALEGLRIVRVRQIALTEFRRDHAGLHDRRGEQVAAQHPEARMGSSAARHSGGSPSRLFDDGATAVLADRLAVDRHGVLMDEASWVISWLTTAGTPPAW
jgi:hypothetical protein